MKLADFDFHLPEDRIALHPASPRDASRLLCVNPDATAPLADHRFHDLPGLLQPGDLMVFNDTRVIPARMLGQRIRQNSEGTLNRIGFEALLLKRLDKSAWSAFAKPGKRLAIGDRVVFSHPDPAGTALELTGSIRAKGEGGVVEIAFEQEGAMLDAAIALVGAMPLPPYILEARRRGVAPATPEADSRDYQTIFAKTDGAVAAPTASLHFTPALIARLEAAGIGHVFATLHVGAGTFLPVKDDNLDAHRMHAEWGEITAASAASINAARAAGGRIIAVGTTACRLLESAAYADGKVQPFCAETDIFIKPGYRFRATDVLITNFHLPKSTLLMLVSAFSGVERMREAYAHAIRTGYRFYSYGDSSLLFPEKA